MRSLIALSALALSACATTPIASNEAGGIVRVRGAIGPQAKGMQTAEAECQKYGRVARYESLNEIRGTLRYSCVKP